MINRYPTLRVEAERLMSEFGDIYDKNRTQIYENTLPKLIRSVRNPFREIIWMPLRSF